MRGMRVEPPTRTILQSQRDHSRTDALVDRVLVDLEVAQDLLDRLHGGAEEVLAELLEAGARDRGVEVDALEERVDPDRRLGGRRQRALTAPAGGAETKDRAHVERQVLLGLGVQLGHKASDELRSQRSQNSEQRTSLSKSSPPK